MLQRVWAWIWRALAPLGRHFDKAFARAGFVGLGVEKMLRGSGQGQASQGLRRELVRPTTRKVPSPRTLPACQAVGEPSGFSRSSSDVEWAAMNEPVYPACAILMESRTGISTLHFSRWTSNSTLSSSATFRRGTDLSALS